MVDLSSLNLFRTNQVVIQIVLMDNAKVRGMPPNDSEQLAGPVDEVTLELTLELLRVEGRVWRLI